MARRDWQVAVEAGPQFMAWLAGRRPNRKCRATMGRGKDRPLGSK
jgi:hypothetical protein